MKVSNKNVTEREELDSVNIFIRQPFPVFGQSYLGRLQLGVEAGTGPTGRKAAVQKKKQNPAGEMRTPDRNQNHRFLKLSRVNEDEWFNLYSSCLLPGVPYVRLDCIS